MNTLARRAGGRLLLVVLLVLAGTAHARPVAAPGAPVVPDLGRLQRGLNGVQRVLNRGIRSDRVLQELLDRANAVRKAAEACIQVTSKQAQAVQQALDTLGPRTPGEARQVSRKRNLLVREKIDEEQRGATCRLLLLNSRQILDTIRSTQQERLTRRLLARGPSVITLLAENWRRPIAWWPETAKFLNAHSGLDRLDPMDWGSLALAVLIAALLGALLRRHLRERVARGPAAESFEARFSCALLATLARYGPALAAVAAAAGSLWLMTGDVEPAPLVAVLAYGLLVYLVLVASIRVFLAPCRPAVPYLPLSPELGRALARRLRVLVALLVVGLLMFATVLSQSLPRPALQLARAAYAVVLVLNVVWIVWLLGRLPYLAAHVLRRVVVTTVMLAALGAEWAGYRNLSVLMLRGLLGTGAALVVTLLARRLLFDVLDGLDQGRHAWQRRLRTFLGLKGEEAVPGLAWLRILIVIALWLGFIAAVLRIWTFSDAGFLALLGYFNASIPVGSAHIVPARLLLAAVMFALFLGASRWVRRRMAERWLVGVRMERGAREALVTITGYVSLAAGLLVVLSVAGVNLTNLAIIAGALSVGIGFGLQNIVNNFVSGIILLFERPIKTGDWIVVGDIEGHVKRISVRSTIIQTFDWADVIVPNSDLISGKVTNWMLRDPWGRVRVPVGVAYGSDTAQVKELLLEVAKAHPDVLPGGHVPAPIVLFLGFGDSSLNFELRCFIRNVDRRLGILSDLNFAVDAAFRAHGVEIPFPQRDLHVRDWQPPPGPG